ncbi:MAG: ATP phosphoribosyltransferase regulatory subunit [Desulfobacteraceae bacterium]|jgi:histidyl-tRNA synthetase
MDTLVGFSDEFGESLRRKRFITNLFSGVVESFGYEPVAVPIIERAEAYNPSIIGLSPWPEWNPNGCFFFEIENYDTTYEAPVSKSSALLIPEGTLSITRWLGAKLSDNNTKNTLPVRVYYNLQCFRNELISTLNTGKRRSFSQFGVEILGSNKIEADLEQIILAYESLKKLTDGEMKIVLRVSCNELFLSIANKSGLNHIKRVKAKELLDTIAECKAGKDVERLPSARMGLEELLSEIQSRDIKYIWDYVIDRPAGLITNRDLLLLNDFGPDAMKRLSVISSLLTSNGMPCEVDFCVVRSHEYYTGITFEIDLIGSRKRYVEVGGGGRYDRLLGNFTPPDGPKSVPCVGFAFGVDRLQSALINEGKLVSSKKLFSNYDLAESDNIEQRNLGDFGDNIDISSATTVVQAYLNTVKTLSNERKEKRISIRFNT